MSRVRPLITALVLALVALALVAPAQAAPNKPPKPPKPQAARITWSTPRVVETVAPGATTTVAVTLTSSADLTDVTLRVPKGLGRVLSVEPAGFASLKAGVATQVTLTIVMPAEGAHAQGGVVQVRAGKRAVPAALKVKVLLPGQTDSATN